MITKQQLGNTLWGMAEILYDKVEDYKTYILSLLFFKRLSDNWTWEIDNKVREHIATYGKEPGSRPTSMMLCPTSWKKFARITSIPNAHSPN